MCERDAVVPVVVFVVLFCFSFRFLFTLLRLVFCCVVLL